MVTTFDGSTTALGDNNCGNAVDGCGVPVAEGGACTATDGIAPGIQDLNDPGCFSFAGSVPATPPGVGCVFADLLNASETGLCTGTITSAGNYNNLVCGTGTVDGWATITTNVPGDQNIELDYTIIFVAGHGVVTVIPDAQDGHSDGAGPIGAGVVDILPQPLIGGCVTTAATGFTATGLWVLTMNDTF
jgi:hypothetical protein